MNLAVPASFIQPDFTLCISSAFFPLLPVCAGSVGKAKMRKNVSRQYKVCVCVRECVCLCVYLRGWSDDCGFSFSPKGLHVMMWLGGRAESSVVFEYTREKYPASNTECPPVWYTLGFIDSGLTLLLYKLRGASVVALHAFVGGEIKNVSDQTIPAARASSEGCWCAHNPRFMSA